MSNEKPLKKLDCVIHNKNGKLKDFKLHLSHRNDFNIRTCVLHSNLTNIIVAVYEVCLEVCLNY